MKREIRHPERLKQAVDWTSHTMGKNNYMTASDIDYAFQFGWGKYAVIGDFKHKNKVDDYIAQPYDRGAGRMAYRDLVEAWNYDPEKRAIYMTIEHDTHYSELINIEECIVREVYFTKGHNYIIPRERQLKVRTVENAFGFCYDIKTIQESPFYEVDWEVITEYGMF